jgi:dienelactone hydrolase
MQEASPVEAVRFTTYDDVELAAHLYLPEHREEWAPGIIVCHGFGSRKENYTDFGRTAAQSGVAALIMDLRGHGESGGQVDANIFNDVAAALLYMQERPEVNPTSISIRGTSMGGWLALHTAVHLQDLSPVVAVCPINEMWLTALMDDVSRVQRGHSSSFVTGEGPRVDVNSVMDLVYNMGLNVSRAARGISPRPLLLVHCEGDEWVPSQISQQIYDTAREPKTLWLLPGGNHHFAQHDPETDARILAWLSDAAKA